MALWVAMDGSPSWRIVRTALVVTLMLAALGWEASPRRWVRALTALGCGLVGATAGAGLGLPHVAKAGLTLPTVLGLAALLAGLALIVVGAVILLHGVGTVRRLIVVPVVVLVTGLTMWTFSPVIAATNVPPTSVGDATPADRGLTYRDVSFETEDGVRLAAWYIPSATGAALVLRHGAGSTRADVLDQAAVLAAHGYGALLVDARGHGDSGGRAMDLGWYGDRDITAAVTFLTRQPGVDADRIGVLGLSMGGEEAVGAAAADSRIKAVVAEGVTGRTDADHRWFSDAYGVRGWVQEQVEAAQSALADVLTAASKPTPLSRAVAAAAAPPMLLIAGGAVTDEPEVATRLQAVAPTRVEVWTVTDSPHTGGLRHAPDEWERRVITFLDANLR